MNKTLQSCLGWFLTLSLVMSQTVVYGQQSVVPVPGNWLQQVQLGSETGKLSLSNKEAIPNLILIPDSHANVGAQKKIISILRELERKSPKPLLIALEGSQGPVAPLVLKAIPNEQDREQIAEHYLNEAKLNGAEYFYLFSKKPALLYGIEKESLYEANREAYLNAKEAAPSVLKKLESEEMRLKKQKSRVLSEALGSFINFKESYHQRKSSFSDYSVELSRYYVSTTGKSLPQLIQKARQIQHLSELVHKPSLEKEIQSIIKQAQKQKNQELVRQAIKLQLQFKLNQICTKTFYSELLNLAERKSKLPHLVQYVKLLNMHEEVDPLLLSREIQQVETAIEQSLIESEKEKEFIKKLKVVALSKKMARLEMSREEFEFYLKEKEAFPSRWLKPAEAFYRLALKRDDTLLFNTLRLSRENRDYQVVVLAGGFHLKGFQSRLESENISHAVIWPQLGTLPDMALYLERLREGRANRLAIGSLYPLSGLSEKAGEIAAENLAIAQGFKIAHQLQESAAQLSLQVDVHERDAFIESVEAYFSEVVDGLNQELDALTARWKREIPDSLHDRFAALLEEASLGSSQNNENLSYFPFELSIGGQKFAITISLEQDLGAGSFTVGSYQVAVSKVHGSGIVQEPQKEKGWLRFIGIGKPSGKPATYEELRERLSKKAPEKGGNLEYFQTNVNLLTDWYLFDSGKKLPSLVETENIQRFAAYNPALEQIVFDTRMLTNGTLANIEFFEELFHYYMDVQRKEFGYPPLIDEDSDPAYEELLIDFEKTRLFGSYMDSEQKQELSDALEKGENDLYGFAEVLSASENFWGKKSFSGEELRVYVERLLSYARQEALPGKEPPYPDSYRKIYEEKDVQGFMRYLFLWHTRQLNRLYQNDPKKPAFASYSLKILKALLNYHFEELTPSILSESEITAFFDHPWVDLEFVLSHFDQLPEELRNELISRFETESEKPLLLNKDIVKLFRKLDDSVKQQLVYNFDEYHGGLTAEQMDPIFDSLGLYPLLNLVPVLSEPTLQVLQESESKRYADLRKVITYQIAKRSTPQLVKRGIIQKTDKSFISDVNILLKSSPFIFNTQISKKADYLASSIKDLSEGATLFVQDPEPEFFDRFLTDERLDLLLKGELQIVFLGGVLNGRIVTKAEDGTIFEKDQEVPEGTKTYLGLDLVDRSAKGKKVKYLSQSGFARILGLQALFPKQVHVVLGAEEKALLNDLAGERKNVPFSAFKGVGDLSEPSIPSKKKKEWMEEYLSLSPWAIYVSHPQEAGKAGLIAAPQIGPDLFSFVLADSEAGLVLKKAIIDIVILDKKAAIEAKPNKTEADAKKLEEVEEKREARFWLEQQVASTSQSGRVDTNLVVLEPTETKWPAKTFTVRFREKKTEAEPLDKTKETNIHTFSAMGAVYPGRKEDMQDRHFALSLDDGVTYIGVFDGMGGHENGALAAEIAKETFEGFQAMLHSRMTNTQIKNNLARLFQEAQRKIDSLPEGGTTATLVVAIPVTKTKTVRLFIMNNGDSRAYWFERGRQKLHFLTVDNEPPSENLPLYTLDDINAVLSNESNYQVDLSEISDEEDMQQRIDQGRELLRALFRDRSQSGNTIVTIKDPYIQQLKEEYESNGEKLKRAKPFFTVAEIPAGDFVLAVSDGVSDPLTHQQIEEALSSSEPFATLMGVLDDRHDDANNLRRKNDDKTAVFCQVGAEIALEASKRRTRVISREVAEALKSEFSGPAAAKPESTKPESAKPEAAKPGSATEIGTRIRRKLKPLPAKEDSASFSDDEGVRELMKGKASTGPVPAESGEKDSDLEAAAKFMQDGDDEVEETDIPVDTLKEEILFKLRDADYETALLKTRQALKKMKKRDPHKKSLESLRAALQAHLSPDQPAHPLLDLWQRYRMKIRIFENLNDKLMDSSMTTLIQKKDGFEFISEFLGQVLKMKEDQKEGFEQFINWIKDFHKMLSKIAIMPWVDARRKELLTKIEKSKSGKELIPLALEVRRDKAWALKHAAISGWDKEEDRRVKDIASIFKSIENKIYERRDMQIWEELKAYLENQKRLKEESRGKENPYEVSYEEVRRREQTFYELREKEYDWYPKALAELRKLRQDLFDEVEKQHPNFLYELKEFKIELESYLSDMNGRPVPINTLIADGAVSRYDRLNNIVIRFFEQKSDPNREEKESLISEQELIEVVREVDQLMLQALFGNFDLEIEKVLQKERPELVQEDEVPESLQDLLSRMREADQKFFEPKNGEEGEFVYAQWENLAAKTYNRLEEWRVFYTKRAAKEGSEFDLSKLIRDNAEAFLGTDQYEDIDLLKTELKVTSTVYTILSYIISRELFRYGASYGLKGKPRKQFSFSSVLRAYILFVLLPFNKIQDLPDQYEEPPVSASEEEVQTEDEEEQYLFTKGSLNIVRTGLMVLINQLNEKDFGFRFFRTSIDQKLVRGELLTLQKRLGRPSDEQRIKRIGASLDEIIERYNEQIGDKAFIYDSLQTSIFFDQVQERSLTVRQYQNIVDRLNKKDIQPKEIVELKDELNALAATYRFQAQYSGATVKPTQDEVEAFEEELEQKYAGDEYAHLSEEELKTLRRTELDFFNKTKRTAKTFPSALKDYFELRLAQISRHSPWLEYSQRLAALLEKETEDPVFLQEVQAQADALIWTFDRGNFIHSESKRYSRKKLDSQLKETDDGTGSRELSFDTAFDLAFDELEGKVQSEQKLNAISEFDKRFVEILMYFANLGEFGDDAHTVYIQYRDTFNELLQRAKHAQNYYQENVLDIYPSKKFETKLKRYLEELSQQTTIEELDKKADQIRTYIQNEKGDWIPPIVEQSKREEKLRQAKLQAIDDLGFMDEEELNAYFDPIEENFEQVYKEKYAEFKIKGLIENLYTLAQARLNKEEKISKDSMVVSALSADLPEAEEDSFRLIYKDPQQDSEKGITAWVLRDFDQLKTEPHAEGVNWTELDLFYAELKKRKEKEEPRLNSEIKALLNESTQSLSPEEVTESINQRVIHLVKEYILETRISLNKKIQNKLLPLIKSAALAYYEKRAGGEVFDKSSLLKEQKDFLIYLQYFNKTRKFPQPREKEIIEMLLDRLQQNEVLKMEDMELLREHRPIENLKIALEIGMKGELWVEYEKVLSYVQKIEEADILSEEWEQALLFLNKALPIWIQEAVIDRKVQDEYLNPLQKEFKNLFALNSGLRTLEFFTGSKAGEEKSQFKAIEFQLARKIAKHVVANNNKDLIRQSIDGDLDIIDQLHSEEAALSDEAEVTGFIKETQLDVPDSEFSFDSTLKWVPVRFNTQTVKEWIEKMILSDFKEEYHLGAVSGGNLLKKNLRIQGRETIGLKELKWRLAYHCLTASTEELSEISMAVDFAVLKKTYTTVLKGVSIPIISTLIAIINSEEASPEEKRGVLNLAKEAIEATLYNMDLQEISRFKARQEKANELKKELFPKKDWNDWMPEIKLKEFFNAYFEEMERLLTNPDTLEEAKYLLVDVLDSFGTEETDDFSMVRDKFNQLKQMWQENPRLTKSILLQKIDWNKYEQQTGVKIDLTTKLELSVQRSEVFFETLFPQPEVFIWLDPKFNGLSQKLSELNFSVLTNVDADNLIEESYALDKPLTLWVTSETWARLDKSIKERFFVVVLSRELDQELLIDFLNQKWHKPKVRRLELQPSENYDNVYLLKDPQSHISESGKIPLIYPTPVNTAI